MDIRIVGAEKVPTRDGNVIVMYREIVGDDGSIVRGRHVMPEDTLEWRAAEYEIDPGDFDTLLDMVLWEPFVEEVPGTGLFDAPTVTNAREAAMDRVAAVRGSRPGVRPKAQQADDTEARELVRGMILMNPEAIAMKRENVRRARNQIASEKRALAAAKSEEKRVEELRRALNARLPRPVQKG